MIQATNPESEDRPEPLPTEVFEQEVPTWFLVIIGVMFCLNVILAVMLTMLR